MSEANWPPVYRHAHLLADAERVEAYRRALEEVVRPGDVVVDLGAGTGILSLLAARAGARRVYAIECDPIADFARAAFAASPFADRIELVEATVQEAALPEPADVAVTETIGTYLLEENIEGLLASARERLLRPGAAEIPGRIGLRIVPLELPPPLVGALGVGHVAGFDFSSVVRALEEEPLLLHFDELGGAALGPEAELWSAPVGGAPARATVSLTIARPGRLHGFALLFSAQLGPTTTLAVELGGRTSWLCPLLPLRGAPAARPGDRWEVSVSVGTDGVSGWTARGERAGASLGEHRHRADAGFDDASAEAAGAPAAWAGRFAAEAIARARRARALAETLAGRGALP